MRQPVRKVPAHILPIVNDKLDELEAAGIITPVTEYAAWQSPIVVVKKKSGDYRICVDMRIANGAVLKESFPSLTIEDLSVRLSGAKFFSKLDIENAFHQIRIDDESSKITTFCTHRGLYKYRVLMFGLSTAPEIFRRVMHHHVLKGTCGAEAIMDDIIVTGRTLEEHDRNLKITLKALDDNNVRIKPQKCVFRQRSVEFVGHKFDEDGIRPIQDKIDALRRCEAPTNKGDLKSFLGLLSYVGYRSIPNLSELTEPLRNLVKGEGTFTWTEMHQKCFETLKVKLSLLAQTSYFDVNDDTLLYADASPRSLGAVLLQRDKKNLIRVIAFGSRTLTPTESRYGQTEREALSLVWSVKHFDFYLRGKHFCLLTDHKPLVSIFKPKPKQAPSTSLRLEHLALKIQDYHFDVQYCEGKYNIADPLSRLPKNENSTDSIIDEQYIWATTQENIPEAISWQEIKDESAKDEQLQKVYEALKNDEWNDGKLKRYEICKEELSVIDGVLLRSTKIVPPVTLRDKILKAAHEGHPGIVKTKQRLRHKVWWPNVDTNAEEFVKACHDCQIVSPGPPPEPMSRSVLPDRPWTDVAIDIMGPLPWGCSILVVVDYYSRFFEVAKLVATTTEEIITHLREFCARWGYPKRMISDNGSQFKSSEFAKFCKEVGIQLRHSTPYFPRMNGEVERMNRLIKKVLQISYNQNSKWWDDLQRFLLMYRTTLHSVTGVEPARLMLGHLPRDKIPTVREFEKDVDYELADRDRMMKQKGKAQADARLRAKPIDLQIGEEVIVKRMKKPNKLSSNFNPTICKVISKRGGETTAVTAGGEMVKRNVSHFKKFYRPQPNSQNLEHTDRRGSDDTNPYSQPQDPALSPCIQPVQLTASSLAQDTTPPQPATERPVTLPDETGFSGFLPKVNSTPAIFQRCREGEMEEDNRAESQELQQEEQRYPRRYRIAPKRLRDSDHAE